MNRTDRAQIAQETVEIIEQGRYVTATHQDVDISDILRDCLAATQLYSPGRLADLVTRQTSNQIDTPETPRVQVANETTLSAARRLVDDCSQENTLCLNFASAKNPGGGFLGGSQAQEESLARSSALYASLLTQQRYYNANRRCGTALYTDHMILSPNVPVIRDDDGNLLRKPFLLSILTAPAVNAGAIRKNEPEKRSQIVPAMADRIERVLALAAHHRYEHLILGAWGCGVFANEPATIAKLFADALLRHDRFRSRFKSVVFAVLDRTAEERTVEPFRRCFAEGAAP